jgi:multisubunit Na+/H+ antiporter MnhE subunit
MRTQIGLTKRNTAASAKGTICSLIDLAERVTGSSTAPSRERRVVYLGTREVSKSAKLAAAGSCGLMGTGGIVRERRGRYVAHWILWWAALVALWLLLTGTHDPQETLAGIVSAALAATAAVIVEAQGVVQLRPRPAWLLRAARRIPGRVVVDNWRVLSLLVRRILTRQEILGAFRAVPFDPGGDDDRSATRRALMTLAITVSPNTYVVGIDRDAKLILCHQLIPSDPESAYDDIFGWL